MKQLYWYILIEPWLYWYIQIEPWLYWYILIESWLYWYILRHVCELVEFKKEEVRSNFRQLHTLLLLRETFLLKKMDDIVTLARQEVAEKGIL